MNVEVSQVEAFVERMFPRPRDRRWRSGGCDRVRTRSPDGDAVAIAEFDSSGRVGRPVGVAGDVESALVMESMVFRAQAQQVLSVGGAAVRPVGDVMDFDEPVAVAARHATASVAVLDEPAGAVRNDVLGSPHRDGETVHDPDR